MFNQELQGIVRWIHSELWVQYVRKKLNLHAGKFARLIFWNAFYILRIIVPVCSLGVSRKSERRFGTLAMCVCQSECAIS